MYGETKFGRFFLSNKNQQTITNRTKTSSLPEKANQSNQSQTMKPTRSLNPYQTTKNKTAKIRQNTRLFT